MESEIIGCEMQRDLADLPLFMRLQRGLLKRGFLVFSAHLHICEGHWEL